MLDDELKSAFRRRKVKNNTGPYEDVIWPREYWVELFDYLKSQAGDATKPEDVPDYSHPIVVRTHYFQLRIHCALKKDGVH